MVSAWTETDPKPTGTSVIVTAGDFKEDLRSEPEQGAAAGEHGPLDDEHRKIGGDGGGSEESGRQPQEPAHAANEGPQPQDGRRRFQRHPFTRLQLKELQRVCQRTQDPDVFARKCWNPGSETMELQSSPSLDFLIATVFWW